MRNKSLIRFVVMRLEATEDNFLCPDGTVDNAGIALMIDVRTDAESVVYDNPQDLVTDLVDSAPDDIHRASLLAALRAAIKDAETKYSLRDVPTREIEADDYVIP